MNILTQIMLALLPVVSILLTVIVNRVADVARSRWGLEIEASHRDALHSALMSGIRAALNRGLSGDAAVSAAVTHAARSVPDAVAALGPTAEVLATLARSKLTEALSK